MLACFFPLFVLANFAAFLYTSPALYGSTSSDVPLITMFRGESLLSLPNRQPTRACARTVISTAQSIYRSCFRDGRTSSNTRVISPRTHHPPRMSVLFDGAGRSNTTPIPACMHAWQALRGGKHRIGMRVGRHAIVEGGGRALIRGNPDDPVRFFRR